MAGANFVSSPSQTDNQNHFDVRLDHSPQRIATIFSRATASWTTTCSIRSPDRRAIRCGAGLRLASSQPRAKCLAGRDAHLHACADQRISTGVQPRLERRLSAGARGPASITSVGLAGAFDQSARLGLEPDFGEWLFAARRRKHQPRARHDEHVSDRRQRHLDARPSPGEVRLRYSHPAAERLSRRRIARVYRFHGSAAGQCAGRIAAGRCPPSPAARR